MHPVVMAGALLFQTVAVRDREELGRALAGAAPGAEIVMAEGTWNDLVVDVRPSGAPGRPITLRAGKPGGVSVTGTSTITLSGDHLVLEGLVFKEGRPADDQGAIRVNGSHCRVTQCSIVGFNRPGFKWISLHGARNRVDHCLFGGKATAGALLTVWRKDDSPNHHRIDRNVFRDYASGGGENGWETIRVGDSSRSQSASFTTVEHNYFRDCDGEIELISNKSCGNVYRFNTIVGCAGHITLRHGNGCTVEGNVILTRGKEGAGGIRVMDRDHVIANNYIEGIRTGSDVRGGIVFMSHDSDPPLNGYWEVKNVAVRNNSLIDCRQALVFGGGRGKIPPHSVLLENNILWNGPGGEANVFARVLKGIRKADYRENVFSGSPLGLDPVPPGIAEADPGLEKDPRGLRLSRDDRGAHPPVVLSEADCGPTTYRP